MAKPRSRRRKMPRRDTAASVVEQPDGLQPGTRNAAMDSLRGLAIVLMVVDHVAAYVGHVSIEPTSVRMPTRLAMPLFCLLMGYFLPPATKFAWPSFRLHRIGQIVLAAVAVNLIYWRWNHELEILASLTITQLVAMVMGPAAPLMMLSLLAYQVDPLMQFFDYQLSLVFAMVAQGIVLRRFGLVTATVTGAVMWLMTISGFWISPGDTHRFLMWMMVPATLLIATAEAKPNWNVAPLSWMGRHPLSIYVAHFYVIAVWVWLIG